MSTFLIKAKVIQTESELKVFFIAMHILCVQVTVKRNLELKVIVIHTEIKSNPN